MIKSMNPTFSRHPKLRDPVDRVVIAEAVPLLHLPIQARDRVEIRGQDHSSDFRGQTNSLNLHVLYRISLSLLNMPKYRALDSYWVKAPRGTRILWPFSIALKRELTSYRNISQGIRVGGVLHLVRRFDMVSF